MIQSFFDVDTGVVVQLELPLRRTSRGHFIAHSSNAGRLSQLENRFENRTIEIVSSRIVGLRFNDRLSDQIERRFIRAWLSAPRTFTDEPCVVGFSKLGSL